MPAPTKASSAKGSVLTSMASTSPAADNQAAGNQWRRSPSSIRDKDSTQPSIDKARSWMPS